jgi:hemerythrin-like domain-containing protein
MEKKPIKRDPALKEFSRDHHFGLLLTWKIREGFRRKIEPARIGRYVTYFFDADLRQHFEEEEELLFSRLPESDLMRIQAESEHALIRNTVDILRKSPGDADQLHSFADMLEKHIRFEERELFEHLQLNLSEKDLASIASKVHSKEHEPDSRWNDIFWN